MAQNAIGGLISSGALLMTDGGSRESLNVTAAGVVKATPGRLCKIVISGTVGTGGNYTFNDCASTGAASASNQIASLAGTTAVSGQPITYNWPCLTGLVVSAFATGGAPILSISWS